jgi:transcriptional regulator with XRE-family HTH domain
VWVRPRDQRLIGECLAAARVRAGISQRELAALLGKPQSFVSAYENGQRRVDLLEFLAIVDMVKADPFAVFREIVEQRSESAPKG